MVVALYCKSGKHRSVAVATCLEHILLTEEKFYVEVKPFLRDNGGSKFAEVLAQTADPIPTRRSKVP